MYHSNTIQTQVAPNRTTYVHHNRKSVVTKTCQTLITNQFVIYVYMCRCEFAYKQIRNRASAHLIFRARYISSASAIWDHVLCQIKLYSSSFGRLAQKKKPRRQMYHKTLNSKVAHILGQSYGQRTLDTQTETNTFAFAWRAININRINMWLN